MGDAGEGLVDAEARAQERMEELQQERQAGKVKTVGNPELQRAFDSLRMAKSDIERQLNATAHAMRRSQLSHALEDVDRRIAEVRARMAAAGTTKK